MSFAIFINYLDGKREPERWDLDYTETYTAGEQITIKLDRHRGKGQVKIIIPKEHVGDFISIIVKEALKK